MAVMRFRASLPLPTIRGQMIVQYIGRQLSLGTVCGLQHYRSGGGPVSTIKLPEPGLDQDLNVFCVRKEGFDGSQVSRSDCVQWRRSPACVRPLLLTWKGCG